ncbi:MAG: thiamine diphosphokinase [Clostridiaceae bacterium]|jgi:thiamine pyrophosphokinase|nr:thiamine diphosphokinase [Bacillota bacterium]NLP07347.1 thiamine diphosphokinase [Clostridiaceae bacterium]HOA54057.1 thiamine diphosphokinase [Clostridiales bacterium]HPZ05814.1 thiamine diphosphokinase [Clostridiales bacterium]HQD30207.1 thiamine diphosphokinase [Clostridiales bacterium]
MTCVIFCGGRIDDYAHAEEYCKKAELVISADSGARHCRALDIVPDILVGDFDSIDKSDYIGLKAAGVEMIGYPAEKDMTDSELAVEIAINRGCSRVILLGAIGSRLDHSISNLFLLKKIHDANVEGIIADEKNEIRLISGSIRLKRKDGVFVTLLPVAGSASGVSTRGLYFPLEGAVLELGSSLGVSNRFSEEEAYIEVKEGLLLVILAKE